MYINIYAYIYIYINIYIYKTSLGRAELSLPSAWAEIKSFNTSLGNMTQDVNGTKYISNLNVEIYDFW